jgi:hypothetical protein
MVVVVVVVVVDVCGVVFNFFFRRRFFSWHLLPSSLRLHIFHVPLQLLTMSCGTFCTETTNPAIGRPLNPVAVPSDGNAFEKT